MGIKHRKSIKSLSEDDRPREKMLLKGKEALSNAELLAILLGSGTKQMNAIELAQLMLSKQNNRVSNLARLSIKELMEFPGIGPAKAVTISAALEIGRRRKLESAKEIAKVTDSSIAYKMIEPHLSDLQIEEFWVLYLNNNTNVLQTKRLSKGGIDGTVVDIRLILKEAMFCNATGIIIAHNHPSGNLNPSTQDIRMTEKLRDALRLVDIRLLDHIVVTQKSYTSFKDEGLL